MAWQNRITKDPFMVTFTVERSHVDGWTGKNAPAVKKKSRCFTQMRKSRDTVS